MKKLIKKITNLPNIVKIIILVIVIILLFLPNIIMKIHYIPYKDTQVSTKFSFDDSAIETSKETDLLDEDIEDGIEVSSIEETTTPETTEEIDVNTDTSDTSETTDFSEEVVDESLDYTPDEQPDNEMESLDSSSISSLCLGYILGRLETQEKTEYFSADIDNVVNTNSFNNIKSDKIKTMEDTKDIGQGQYICTYVCEKGTYSFKVEVQNSKISNITFME